MERKASSPITRLRPRGKPPPIHRGRRRAGALSKDNPHASARELQGCTQFVIPGNVDPAHEAREEERAELAPFFERGFVDACDAAVVEVKPLRRIFLDDLRVSIWTKGEAAF